MRIKYDELEDGIKLAIKYFDPKEFEDALQSMAIAYAAQTGRTDLENVKGFVETQVTRYGMFPASVSGKGNGPTSPHESTRHARGLVETFAMTFNTTTGSSRVFMLMSEAGTLRDAMNHKLVHLGDAFRGFQDIIEGLTTMHAMGVLHHDIKPENIGIRDNHTWELIDLCCGQGTYPYMASNAKEDTSAVDWLALIIVILESADAYPRYGKLSAFPLSDNANKFWFGPDMDYHLNEISMPIFAHAAVRAVLDDDTMERLGQRPLRSFGDEGFDSTIDHFTERVRQRWASAPKLFKLALEDVVLQALEEEGGGGGGEGGEERSATPDVTDDKTLLRRLLRRLSLNKVDKKARRERRERREGSLSSRLSVASDSSSSTSESSSRSSSPWSE